MTRVIAALSLAGFSFAALADEAAVRRMVQDKLRGGGELGSVQKAPFGDLYEVIVRGPDGPLIYYPFQWATFERSLYVSRDAGRTWTPIAVRGNGK